MLFKYFYKQRPNQAKCNTYCPVSKLLEVLAPYITIIPQTINFENHCFDSPNVCRQRSNLASVNNMHVSSVKVEFIIRDKVKTTIRILKPTIITCVSSDVEELNVAEYVKVYRQS